MCDSRGIALISSTSKLIDLIIFRDTLTSRQTSSLQYTPSSKNFQLLYETVQYYLNNGPDVYCCMLDTTKAFDRFRYDKLIDILLAKGIPHIIIRLLIDMCEKQRVRASWNHNYSNYITVTNDIRQGGIISPVLCTI